MLGSVAAAVLLVAAVVILVTERIAPQGVGDPRDRDDRFEEAHDGGGGHGRGRGRSGGD